MTIARTSLPDAVADKLFFAQVREDARAELEALHPGSDETVVVVSSGGCTMLSLLAAGAGRVVGVDRNATQNHMVELKAASTRLGPREAIAFLGAAPSVQRPEAYAALRASLTPHARAYWDSRPSAVRRGVLASGASEHFISAVVATLRLIVHPRDRLTRLLACRSVDEQRVLFEREWNTRRWRALFAVLCNRLAFRSTYPAAFFEHVENPSFARHFRQLAEHALTDLPVRDNYFLHQMLTGHYPADVAGGVPAYLSQEGVKIVATHHDRLTLVDGGMVEYLRACAPRSIHAFALSNICEWMDPGQIDALFREVSRTAAPGARLVYRNFVGWTELPSWCTRIVPDVAMGSRLSRTERSVVQRRVVACNITECA